MPDSGLLFLSLASLIVGTLLFLHPKAILVCSSFLNRTLVVLDDALIRRRYVVGLLAFIASYAFFKLALLIGTMTR